MSENEATVDAHNKRDLSNEIISRLETSLHELDLVFGLLDDFGIYDAEEARLLNLKLQPIEAAVEDFKNYTVSFLA